MTARIDVLLLDIAKKILIFADFFGISRWQVTIGWIITSELIDSVLLKNPLFGKPWGFIFGAILWTVYACLYYREDDILPNDGMFLTYRQIRLIFVVYLPLGALSASHHAATDFLHFFTPILFFVYFLLQQNPRCKMRLKDRVKSWGKSLKTALTPAPQPLPQPAACSRTPGAVLLSKNIFSM